MEMESKVMEVNGMRTRSFREEDYNNRRVFLRSYPLQWEGKEKEKEEKEKEEMVRVSKEGGGGGCGRKRKMKKILLSVFQWGGGKALVLRKFKFKVTFYLVSCHSFGFRAPTALISV